MKSRKDFDVQVPRSSRCRTDNAYHTSQTGFPGTQVILQALTRAYKQGGSLVPTVRKHVSQTPLSEVRDLPAHEHRSGSERAQKAGL